MKNKEIPQYKLISNELYDCIINGTYVESLPTEQELCKKYNVSRITIQKALKILCDKEIIYRIIGKGTFVNKNRSKQKNVNPLIGVVLCNISASFGTEMLKAIEKNATINNFSIIFKNSDFSREKEIIALKQLIDLDVAGIILQPTHGEASNPEIMHLDLLNKPIVLVDRNLSSLNCSFVGSDNYQATSRVMKELFLRGHRQICFMCSNPENTTSTTQRIQAFKDSFVEYGIEYKDDFVFDKIKSTMSLHDLYKSKEDDIEIIKQYIKNHPEVTCYFALEYTISTLVKKALKELNVSNKKVSVVTFDYVSDPHVITDTAYVKQYEDEIGYQAVKLLIRSIDGDKSAVKLYLPTELVNLKSIIEIERVIV